MDHKKVAQQVIDAVGRDNMVGAAHCATRLRLVLKDDSKIDQAALDANPDVKGTFKTNGQYQIIIGPGDVNNVYAELIKETGLKEASTEELKKVAEQGKKFNPVMAFIKLLSDIFVPIIPALVAGGLLMALNNFLTSKGLFGAKALVEMYPNVKGLSDMIQLMSAAPFIFMPIRRYFGCQAFWCQSVPRSRNRDDYDFAEPSSRQIMGYSRTCGFPKQLLLSGNSCFGCRLLIVSFGKILPQASSVSG